MSEVCRGCGGTRYHNSDRTNHEAVVYGTDGEFPSDLSWCPDGHQWVNEDQLIKAESCCSEHLSLQEVMAFIGGSNPHVPEKAAKCAECFRVAARGFRSTNVELTGSNLVFFDNPRNEPTAGELA